jgi:phenylacetate-CoA ligase
VAKHHHKISKESKRLKGAGLYNKVLENWVLPLGDSVLGTQYISALKELRIIQNYSEEELQKLQKQKLENLLVHATNNIPFYQSFSSPSKSRVVDFPILTKAMIREHGDNFIWHPQQKNTLICEKSSGSSGIQGQVYMSRMEQSKIQAAQTLLWEWAGYSIGSSILQTGITPKRSGVKKIKDTLFKTQYESAFGLDEQEVGNVLQGLKDEPRAFFGGYASSLYVYAQVAAKKNIQSVQFDSVISWGDKMFSHYRSLIESQFNTKVFDTYGTTEGFMIAGQKDLEYYYILSPQVYLEVVDDKGNEVPDGEMGYVLVTSLDAYEMPLIRYYLGDLAVKLPRDRYPENRALQFPLLERVIGRDTDIVRTPSGKNMIVHFFTGIFEHIPEIKQFRIVQSELNSLIVEYIPGENYNETVLNTVRAKIQGHLKEDFPVHFNHVSEIPSSQSGKPQIIISHLRK